LVALKYFVQSDWRIMVQNLELPYNVKLKDQVVTDRVPSGFYVWFVLLNLICWHIHAPLYYPNYNIYFIVIYMYKYIEDYNYLA
jgi:hypothetical protein